MERYDMVIIGHVSRDTIVVPGRTEHLLGGAVVQAAAAAARSGARVLVITKAAAADRQEVTRLFDEMGVACRPIGSRRTTAIENTYESADRERRRVRLLSRAEPFRLDEVGGYTARLVYLAGLFAGELPDPLIEPLSQRALLAIDAQGVMRCSEAGRLVLRNWAAKGRLLPHVAYLKADAAEAEILTGSADCDESSERLVALGASEVMVTRSGGVVVANGTRRIHGRFTSSNLSGRTGRGDSCFAAYLTWRAGHGIDESVAYAAALTSLKMERPGPFGGTVDEVLQRVTADRAQ